jgi:hypothetical protein
LALPGFPEIGKTRGRGRRVYFSYVKAGVGQGRREDLIGGS